MRREYILPATAIAAFCCGILGTLGFQEYQQSSSVGKALELSQKAAHAGDFYAAQDFWLIAANADPANPALAKAAGLVIRKSQEVHSEDAAAVADSLRERLPLLIPYQLPESVAEFRSAIQPWMTGEETRTEPPSLYERIDLISKELDPEIAKTKALRLREEIDDSLADTDAADEAGRKHLREALARLEAREIAILRPAYDSTLDEVKTWQKSRADLEKKAADGLFTHTGELSVPMTEHAQKGMVLAEQLAAFSAGGLKEADLVRSTLTKACERLSRASDWVYNQEALKVLHEVRDNHPADATFRADKLVTVDATRLNPLVTERYQREYHYLFHEILKEDEAQALELMKGMTVQVFKQP